MRERGKNGLAEVLNVCVTTRLVIYIVNIIIGTRGVWRNGSLSRRRCADGLEHMCSQGRLFATPITGTSNRFRPRQRRLRGPTHGKWEESLLVQSCRLQTSATL